MDSTHFWTKSRGSGQASWKISRTISITAVLLISVPALIIGFLIGKQLNTTVINNNIPEAFAAPPKTISAATPQEADKLKGTDATRVIDEIGLHYDGRILTRDNSIGQMGIDHWEQIDDGTLLFQFGSQIDPNTLRVRINGTLTPLEIVERGSHKVRFTLPTLTSGRTIVLVVDGS
jgi:hypothetical protein